MTKEVKETLVDFFEKTKTIVAESYKSAVKDSNDDLVKAAEIASTFTEEDQKNLREFWVCAYACGKAYGQGIAVEAFISSFYNYMKKNGAALPREA